MKKPWHEMSFALTQDMRQNNKIDMHSLCSLTSKNIYLVSGVYQFNCSSLIQHLPHESLIAESSHPTRAHPEQLLQFNILT